MSSSEQNWPDGGLDHFKTLKDVWGFSCVMQNKNLKNKNKKVETLIKKKNVSKLKLFEGFIH